MEFELDAKNFHFAEAMYRSGSEPPLVDIRLFDGKKKRTMAGDGTANSWNFFSSFLALKTTFHVWQRRVMIDSSRTEDVGEEAGCNDCKNQYFSREMQSKVLERRIQ